MKWGKDFWIVCCVVLALACVLQQAILGNALSKLEAVITDIELLAEQQGNENGGWVFIELTNESGGEK